MLSWYPGHDASKMASTDGRLSQTELTSRCLLGRPLKNAHGQGDKKWGNDSSQFSYIYIMHKSSQIFVLHLNNIICIKRRS